MNRFFRSRFFICLLVVTILVLILMAISTANTEKASFAENALGVVVSPIQRVFHSVGSGTASFFDSFRSAAKCREENEELKKSVAALEEKTRDFYKLTSENERLRGLLALKETQSNFDMVGARVIAKDAGTWYHAFKIDKGTSDGISKYDTVMTDKGLAGYVYEVGTNWSNVVSVIDYKSALGCIIERTGDTAIAEGNMDLMASGLCKLSYLSRDSQVAVGDFVETSGLGGIYPEGLYVGKIKSLSVDAQGLYYEAVVEPAVDFKRIVEVMVIRGQGAE